MLLIIRRFLVKRFFVESVKCFPKILVNCVVASIPAENWLVLILLGASGLIGKLVSFLSAYIIGVQGLILPHK